MAQEVTFRTAKQSNINHCNMHLRRKIEKDHSDHYGLPE